MNPGPPSVPSEAVGHVEMPHSNDQMAHSERVDTAARDQAIRVVGGAIVPGHWPVEVMAAAATDALTGRPDVLLALLTEREPGRRDTREALVSRLERLRAARDATRAERVETAARLLHDRRHRAGTSDCCDRCRDDARAVAAVLAPKEAP